MLSFPFPFYTPFGRKSKTKTKKAKKAPKENWFCRLSVDELKELCRVVGEKVWAHLSRSEAGIRRTKQPRAAH